MKELLDYLAAIVLVLSVLGTAALWVVVFVVAACAGSLAGMAVMALSLWLLH